MERAAKIKVYLELIYPKLDCDALAKRILSRMRLQAGPCSVVASSNKWSEKDLVLISYGDSVVSDPEPPLRTLKSVLDKWCKGTITAVHILPFFPYSSDDGFSVINYTQVNPSLGDWSDIEAISRGYDLMSDLVINHCSSRSRWFENYKAGLEPGKGYFIEAEPSSDLSAVVRPRTSPLLKPVRTVAGDKHVWCTFSHDQVDLNFANPDVLLEMVGVIRKYLEHGVRIFRLDAVAFLWKRIGTQCVHLDETHAVIALLRVLIEEYSSDAVIITETNVPNTENLSYFGGGREAHAVYNFSLPPLVLHTMMSGDSSALRAWQTRMPPAKTGNFYFNFIASHDGIGLRPVEGLLPANKITELVEVMESFGAKISWRSGEDAKPQPYEINVALFDAMKGTLKGEDEYQIQRFICAHAIMFALEGVPGLYIHSLFAAENDVDRFELSGQNRSINRHRWSLDLLNAKLEDQESHHKVVYHAMRSLIEIRGQQPAFHPNAAQYTLSLGKQVFAFWRQSIERDQSIFCLNNISDQAILIDADELNLISEQSWHDLISGAVFEESIFKLELRPYQTIWLTNYSA